MAKKMRATAPMLIVLLLSITLLSVVAHAYVHGVAYNVTFLEPLDEHVSGWLLVPGRWLSVSLGETCTRPLNATPLYIDGYTFFVFRGSVGSGESIIVSACNATAPVGDGFVLHRRVVLEAVCSGEYNSFTTYRSGSSISYSYDFNGWVILHNVTVTVTAYVYPRPSDVTVELCPEGYSCVSRTHTVSSWGERFTVTFEGPWNTTGFSVSVSTQAWYSYFYAGITPRYTMPTSDSDSVTLGPFDAALLEMAGVGTVRVNADYRSFNGFYRVAVTPYGTSFNGSYTATTGNSVEIGTSCYGVSVRRIVVIDYYASNLTREEIDMIGSFVESSAARPAANITIDVALNTSGLENAITAAANTTIEFAATASSTVLSVAAILAALLSLMLDYPLYLVSLFASPLLALAALILAANAPLVSKTVAVIAMLSWLVAWILRVLRGE